MVIDSLFPVFAIILLGHILGRVKFAQRTFFAAADRLVYFILFPALLFYKIGGTGRKISFDWPLIAAVALTVIGAYLLTLLLARVMRMPALQVGSFSQLGIRFNTYVGLAVLMSAYNHEGAVLFGLLIALIIPMINALCVGTIIWYSQHDYGPSTRAWLVVKSLVGNPLIIGCAAGILFGLTGLPLPTALDNTFQLLASSALPLALMSIGNGLTLKGLAGHLRLSAVAAVVKLAFMPFLGWCLLRWFGVTGLPLQVAMLFFTLPAPPNAFILSTQLGSDPDLAAAGIVLSTLLSFFSLSVALYIGM